MSKYYGSEKTLCPFYKDETKNSIKCEGEISISSNQNFENATAKKEHKKVFCDKNYSQCNHFKSVNKSRY